MVFKESLAVNDEAASVPVAINSRCSINQVVSLPLSGRDGKMILSPFSGWFHKYTQMNPLIVTRLILILILWFYCLPANARLWTARDSVELSKITGFPKFAPDGSRFLVVSSRGVLSTNQIESTIWLFDSKRVKAFCRSGSTLKDAGGKPILKRAADTYDETGYPVTISNLAWGQDGKHFYFLSRGRSWERTLFICDLQTGHTKALSEEGEDVADFAIRGTAVLYLASHMPDPATLYQAGPGADAPDIVRGTGFSSMELMFPNLARLRYGLAPLRIHSIDEKGRNKSAGEPFLSLSPQLSVSPDGQHAVVKAQVKMVPAEWAQYEPRSKDYSPFKADSFSQEHSKVHRPEQFMLADLKSGKMTPLTNTPDAEMLGYHHDDGLDWSPDSRRIAVSNSFFPLPPPGKSSKLVLHPCVLVVDLGSSKVALVRERDYNNNKQLPVWDLRWNKDGSVLQIQGDGLGQSYKKQGDDWLESGEPAKVAGEKIHDLEVFRYQSLNSPPVLIAHLTGETEDLDSLVKTQKAKIILNPNPQLADVEPGECSVYKWKDKGGRDCLGGLLKPPGYKPGLRYPLLVQTHLFNQYEFFNLGASSTGNPGRALAARGVMVLQAGEPRQNSKYRGTPLEAEKDGRDCYVSAIKQLAAEGLIDAQNTGIIGFSRTGWYVLDSLIHASEYFRAATVADANSSSYGEYLRNVDINSDGSNYLDGDYGCKPYGEGLKNWMESASGFNLDKVRAPVLVQYSDPYGLLDWSTYPVLRMQGKPVDLLYFRNGSHTESKPKLVFASVETNADWFDFWLNGKEDQDPAKAAQYARWRGLRKLQDSGSKK